MKNLFIFAKKQTRFIVANWKANKTSLEAKEWLQEISNNANKEIIVCPPLTLLSDMKSLIANYQLPITLGVQDISAFDEGAYTGEVNGKQIKEFADYVIIGHSERRQNFKETDEMLVKKVQMAQKYLLTPIFCIQDQNTFIPEGVKIIAYEPVGAIGTGNPDTPENADKTAQIIKDTHKNVMFVLYGGSVTSTNVSSFTKMPSIDGVLVGGASLDASEFGKIIQYA